ncbi:MAG: hypothetical protein A2W90_12205 [Bacteroidetes bacterium GWF2_42_66]|nr:MAG: hypothetical protein A2W92_23220 [Bacteroidetes bacterium GWA2_42_15]OFX99952.1 MAG: hypothetical protein A2W89_17190 [Bacteroidetes bacterium GWE2_42_39]OFY40137.1 MAG: hypothetical protein A2W90_12205 [Bacteroidetes bacterium GWF2_42_66]HBL73962.1 hypothetical protein [Prolixibacteraceae bacterium]HCR89228.1 hypothetical protein [Prolixibacteraceae bacterium]
MSIDEKINIRIKALKFNLDELNEAYNLTTRDVVTETGMEYGKQYLYNEETLSIIRKQDKLKKEREERLHFTILNFTQVFYSVKEYLKKGYPEKRQKVEDFFSNIGLGNKARKDISNDLKHNPQNDIKYGFGEVGKEETKDGTKRITKIYFKHTWFYGGIDSVEYCNNLYKELSRFIHDEFPNIPIQN